jgi:hypothetical protein
MVQRRWVTKRSRTELLAALQLQFRRLLQSERSGRDWAGARPGRHDDAGAGGGEVLEDESDRRGAVTEETLAVPDDDREDQGPELVDQVRAEKRLDQIPAAVDLDLRPVLRLELGDLGGNVAIEDAGSPPAGSGRS